MSIWTHVCGAIRFDGMLIKHQPALKMIESQINHEIPGGTEGPLDLNLYYTGYEEEMSSSLNIATLVVSGDLRDFDDAYEIWAWVKDLVERLKPYILPRQVALLVEVENKGLWLIRDQRDEDHDIHISIERMKP